MFVSTTPGLSEYARMLSFPNLLANSSSMKNVCGLAQHGGLELVVLLRSFRKPWVVPSEASWSFGITVHKARDKNDAGWISRCGGLAETWNDEVGKEEVA